MKYIFYAVLCILPITTYAQGTFDERVKAATQLEHTSVGRQYQAKIRNAIGVDMNKIIGHCGETIDSPDKSPFTLVADITRDSSLENIEVRPDTNVATCIADGLSSTPFPSPPASFAGDKYPFVLQMHFH